MINNKILTVSYGTFSCTLEGFDDSFGTMKAIAEYFRDLAADDRYFGAEPPQPDAEMLARIAQREITRKVQAHERDGKIVLSALEDQRTEADDTTRLDEKSVAPAVVAPVAAELTAQQSVDEATPLAAEEPQETGTTDDLQGDAAAAEVAIEDPEDENDIVPGQPDADVEAFFAERPQSAPVRDESAAGADNISAKLQRIRAVVAQNTADTDEGSYAEDQHAEAKARNVEKDIVQFNMPETAGDADAETLHEDADAAVMAEEEEGQQAELLHEVAAAAPEHAEETDTFEKAATLEDDDGEDGDVDSILERLATATSADASDPLDDDDFEDDDLQGADTLNLFEDSVGSQETEDDGVSELAAHDTALRASVIKVKRADLEAAIENGTLEEYEDDVEATAPEAPTLDQIAPSRSKTSSLTPQDEAELLRELASLQTEADEVAPDQAIDIPDLDEADDHDAEASKPAARRSDLRPKRALDDTDRGTDVNRLLAEADHQMDEPESATRRNAFSHLRAAVASQKAEVAMGDPAKAEDQDKAYRGDLAEVVRPRRPESGGQRTARPDDVRPAPLKLVAEQRIDSGVRRNDAPVRPRRVTAVQDPDPTMHNTDSFAEYAADVGADTLPQLLEAAASYMAFVEGRDQFSRPQLMTKVRQSGAQEDFSREDGLRSFGQLLRAGKISKIKGGRFTVSDDIGFQPNERAAG